MPRSYVDDKGGTVHDSTPVFSILESYGQYEVIWNGYFCIYDMRKPKELKQCSPERRSAVCH
eukprot:3683951-Pleurochrysis_carterae.AAC.2